MSQENVESRMESPVASPSERPAAIDSIERPLLPGPTVWAEHRTEAIAQAPEHERTSPLAIAEHRPQEQQPTSSNISPWSWYRVQNRVVLERWRRRSEYGTPRRHFGTRQRAVSRRGTRAMTQRSRATTRRRHWRTSSQSGWSRRPIRKLSGGAEVADPMTTGARLEVRCRNG